MSINNWLSIETDFSSMTSKTLNVHSKCSRLNITKQDTSFLVPENGQSLHWDLD